MTVQKKQGLSIGTQFSPLSVARMLWKNRLSIFLLWAVLTAIAMLLVSRRPNIYRAEAVILVDSQKIPENFVSSTVQVSLQDSINSISKQVLSTDNLMKIVDDFDLYPEAKEKRSVEELVDRIRSKDLTVKLERSLTGKSSGAFRISFDGLDPNVTVQVVNRVTDLFIRENVKTRGQRAQGTSQFIETQMDQAKKALEEQEANLSKYKLKWSGELPQQETVLMSELAMKRAELQSNQENQNRAEQNRLMLENSISYAETSLTSASRALTQALNTPQTVVRGVPVVQGQEPPPLASIVLEAQLNAARLRYYDDHPEVKRLRLDLEQVKASEAKSAAAANAQRGKNPVDKNEKAPERILLTAPQTAIAQLQDDVKREKDRLANLKAQYEVVNKEIATRKADRLSLVAQIGDNQTRVGKLPIREQQMAALTRDYEISKLNYRNLHDKKVSADISAEMERSEQSERFTIAEPPHVPTTPVAPNRLLYNIVGCLAAMALSLSFFLGLELQKDRFLGEWELPSHVSVLGRIPNITMHPHHEHQSILSKIGFSSGVSLVLLALSGVGLLAAFLTIGGTH